MEVENKVKDSIEPVSITSTKKISNQLMNCICKIKIKDKYGTGFFCLIPFKNESIKVFITSYYILNEKDLEESKSINLFLNDEKDVLTIELGIKRDFYFNKDYDITIIELNDEDEIKNYLELDDNLFKDKAELIYYDKSVYILHYPNGKNAFVSYGLLNDIDKYNIIHKCTSDNGSYGAPILNLQNNKVIGINKKGSINSNHNLGTLLISPIKAFLNQKLEYIKIPIFLNNIEYKVIKELGRGGFGRVYKVLKKSERKLYALKQIPIIEETKERIKKIQNESINLSKCESKNIVKFYDSYLDKKKNFYIIMEYCDGENLRSFIDKHIKDGILIEENIIKNIVKQICTGLKVIYDSKIVHRDLKPENIFINGNFDIKIGDFGLSKKLNFFSKQALTINKAGSDYYIAPETFFQSVYHEKSDIWSLGCIIYELFNLSIYSKDKHENNIKKIDTKFYNYKWQELIDSLLQKDIPKRFNINQVNQFLKENFNIIINNGENGTFEKIRRKSTNIINNIKNIFSNIKNDNIIIGEININKNDINKNIQIINSYENFNETGIFGNDGSDLNYKNELEIINNIEIKINGIKIEFTYFYKFNKEGKYKIEYSFKQNLTKTCYMFYGCDKLINLNLSNFNTENVTNMNRMFKDCNSLTNINLANFNTKNISDMSYMFYGCKSLKKLDLSSFDATNDTNTKNMFTFCDSLTNLDLSNFNINLDLSNFDSQKNNKNSMFFGCKKLKKENIITKDNKE